MARTVWVLWTLALATGLCWCLWRWLAEGDALAGSLSGLEGSLGRLARDVKTQGLRVDAIGEDLNRCLGVLSVLAARRDRSPDEAGLATGDVSAEPGGEPKPLDATAIPGAGGAEGAVEPGSSPGAESAGLPAQRNPELLLKADLARVLEEPGVNPEGRTLNRVEAARARLLLARARAQVDTLEAEVQVHLAEALEDLRSRGAFVEYAPGEACAPVPGALSAGEEIPGGGVRMYYLYPEEFPDVHEKRRQKASIAREALRQLAAELSP